MKVTTIGIFCPGGAMLIFKKKKKMKSFAQCQLTNWLLDDSNEFKVTTNFRNPDECRYASVTMISVGNELWIKKNRSWWIEAQSYTNDSIFCKLAYAWLNVLCSFLLVFSITG